MNLRPLLAAALLLIEPATAVAADLSAASVNPLSGAGLRIRASADAGYYGATGSGILDIDNPLAVNGGEGATSLTGFDGRVSSSPWGHAVQALGYADLPSGRLGVIAMARVDTPYSQYVVGGASSYIQAFIRDQLTLHLPSASPDPASPAYRTELRFKWAVDGHGVGAAPFKANLILSTLGAGVYIDLLQRPVDSSPWSTTFDQPTITDIRPGSRGNCHKWVCEITLTVLGQNPSITFYTDLEARAGADRWSTQYQKTDFTHTSTFAFEAPPIDMSFTSTSGVFLTQPVPELPTLTLLLAGLGMLARRRAAN